MTSYSAAILNKHHHSNMNDDQEPLVSSPRYTMKVSIDPGNLNVVHKGCIFSHCNRKRLIFCIGLLLTVLTLTWTQVIDLSLVVDTVCPDSLFYPKMLTDSEGRQHPEGTEHRLPKAIIIGVRKCGTRALLDFVNIHPNVVAASHEVHYFDNATNYAKGRDWYLNRMPYSYPEEITIEKSPAYFITDKVPERIYNFNSSVKLLVIFRNPVTRTISDYTQIYQKRLKQNLTTERFEHLVMDPITLEVNTKYMAVQISIYQKYLENYFRVFNRNQIHIVDGDKLISNPAMEIAKVEKFLGLERFVTPDTFYFNKTRGFHCIKKDGVERCLAEGKGRKHPNIDPFVLHKLKKFFQPHNKKLFQMIGQTFDWD
ncbi:unnamed protein product [Owenia fusiformis]|uniref:Heparan sulfate glucosamine 3-O-sulfotransferase 5 n=1 Tax=Owenia fusiformis TaxID=6347 RepID=A0A8J1UU02_OWEFU|nr:unnamed protein product [Owenia fusiformis]